ncbi:unnamed protein product [Echinostoma caproni]|uniref:GOLD domain-containing protein n=1 Tax=Echinostoma caproni TaxID=27848 RepID=A0A183B7W3_9TREM|nr:unnamed protein product [Echinostoma caproni]
MTLPFYESYCTAIFLVQSLDSDVCDDNIYRHVYRTCLGVRVPAYPSGTSIVWEFATDDYDIAFGLFFEWSTPSELAPTEPHGRGVGSQTQEAAICPLVDEIIPVYRRKSHEEVYCGSHVYPGLGTYLFKFDNSYSLWRSKTLYYRVYYTC